MLFRSSYNFNNGSQNATLVHGSGTTIDIDNATEISSSVTAIDTRGLSTSVTKSFSVLAEYVSPTLFGISLSRDATPERGGCISCSELGEQLQSVRFLPASVRTTPNPPRPGGVAIATMVSSGANTGRSSLGDGPRADYLRTEMVTVFEKASPMLSVDTPGIASTARWTSRRSYGFSGPSC